MLTDRTRRGTARAATRSHRAVVLVAAIAAGWTALGAIRPATAQYLDPDDRGGYLNPPPHTGEPGLFPSRPEPLVTFGVGLDLGVGFSDYDEIDSSWFEPNATEGFGSFATFALEGAGWLELAHHFRVGISGGTQLSGSGETFTNSGHGGLLLEGGGPLVRNSPVAVWGGGIFGFEGLYARSRDPLGREFKYYGDSLLGRIHVRFEIAVSPWAGLRVTGFYTFTHLLNEDLRTYRARAQDIVFPASTDFTHRSTGFLVGVTFGF